MNEEELYLFDLNGYVVFENALSESEVAELNATIDGKGDWGEAAGAPYIHTGMDERTMSDGNSDPREGPVDFYWGELLTWGEPLRRLVSHPRVLDCLSHVIGPDVRLDHSYAIFARLGHELSGSHALHGGGTPYDDSQYYHFRDGRPRSGLTVVSYALTDSPRGAGGFCCIPGSHKSNLPMPERYTDLDDPVAAIVEPDLKAGDVLVFTEALSHGSLTWTATEERRALLYKYAPGHMRWEPGTPFVDVDAYDWDPQARSLLEPAYVNGRPSLP
jgi:ectoine hydroxylase-related dioxygenase (phytanoyl-CoA dioxygenase family)